MERKSKRKWQRRKAQLIGKRIMESYDKFMQAKS